MLSTVSCAGEIHFIDQSESITYIWGNRVGDVWNKGLGVQCANGLHLKIYPNPTKDRIHFSGIKTGAQSEVFTMDGLKLAEHCFNSDGLVDLTSEIGLASGIYAMRIISNGKLMTKKIIIEWDPLFKN